MIREEKLVGAVRKSEADEIKQIEASEVDGIWEQRKMTRYQNHLCGNSG